MDLSTRTLVTGLVSLVIVATAAGCAPRQHAGPAHPCAGKQALAPSGARAPEDLDRLFGERLNAGDVDGVAALYEPTATIVRQDRSLATGAAAIHEEIAGFVALKPRITLNVLRVLPGGSDIAVVHDDWTATGTDAKGKHLHLSGRASEVVRRGADGDWRFVVDDPDARGAPATAAPGHKAATHQKPAAHHAHRSPKK